MKRWLPWAAGALGLAAITAVWIIASLPSVGAAVLGACAGASALMILVVHLQARITTQVDQLERVTGALDKALSDAERMLDSAVRPEVHSQ